VVTGGIDLGSNTGSPGTIVSAPTGGGLDGIPDVQLLEYSGKPDTINATQFNGRLDFQATQKDLIAFSVYKSPFIKSFQPGGWVDGRQYNVFNTDAQHDAATALWTRTINGTTVNEARFNVTHWFFDELKGNPQAPWGLPTETHFNLGNIAVKEEKYQEALREFEAAAKLDPDLSKVHFAMARLYRRLGWEDAAVKETQIHNRLKAKEEQDSEANVAIGAHPSR